jgi:hypothetical protein
MLVKLFFLLLTYIVIECCYSDIAALQIGTPAREFKLLVDSGSSDLWVGGEGCQSPGGTANCVCSC